MEGFGPPPFYFSPRTVATTVVCDDLPGLQAALTAVLPEAAEMDVEVLVAAGAPSQSTRRWLPAGAGSVTILESHDDIGLGGSRYSVFRMRPSARSYSFSDDDVIFLRPSRGLSHSGAGFLRRTQHVGLESE